VARPYNGIHLKDNQKSKTPNMVRIKKEQKEKHLNICGRQRRVKLLIYLKALDMPKNNKSHLKVFADAYPLS